MYKSFECTDVAVYLDDYDQKTVRRSNEHRTGGGGGVISNQILGNKHIHQVRRTLVKISYAKIIKSVNPVWNTCKVKECVGVCQFSHLQIGMSFCTVETITTLP